MVQSFERTSELRSFVGALAQLRDGIGVLSITIGIRPGEVGGGTRSWKIALENDFARLSRDGEVRSVLKPRLEQFSSRLEELLDPSATGRGRVQYVALESGVVRAAMMQPGLPTRVRLGQVAHVLPLLAVLDAGEPAGLLTASRDSISVSELELGRVRHVERIELEPEVGDWWPEMKGPARANPQRGPHTVSHRERYARRVADAYRHTLYHAASRIRALVGEREWKRAVIAGDARRTDVLEAVLREQGLSTTTIEANLEGVQPEHALERLQSALATLVARDRARLAEDVVSAANAVCGLVPVLAALTDRRAERLLIDADRTFQGVVGPEQRLAAARSGEESTDIADLIVAGALAIDATVIPLTGHAARVLANSEGIAAVLRW